MGFPINCQSHPVQKDVPGIVLEVGTACDCTDLRLIPTARTVNQVQNLGVDIREFVSDFVEFS